MRDSLVGAWRFVALAARMGLPETRSTDPFRIPHLRQLNDRFEHLQALSFGRTSHCRLSTNKVETS